MSRTSRSFALYAGGAGGITAALAALCCAGLPIILSVLAATGLSFLRTDAILLPAIIIAAAIALSGFWKGRAIHRSMGPFKLGTIGTASLLLGVVVLHGVIAKATIGIGAVALLISTIWNAQLIGRCKTPS